MDTVSMSAGGRVAKIYLHKERRRKITSMMNNIESKRLQAIKKQIEVDEATEKNLLERNSKKILQSNDDIKAFQKALLQRISTVKERSQMSDGIRPLINLGRYGGASINQIKVESERYKPIRNPEQRRIIRTKILLEQGRRDGRIRTFHPETLGDVTEHILQLEKVTEKNPSRVFQVSSDIANLQDVNEEDGKSEENTEGSQRQEKVNLRRKGLILPPLQVSRSKHPNFNYYRQISSEYKMMRSETHGKRGPGLLNGISEEAIRTDIGAALHQAAKRKVKRTEQNQGIDKDKESHSKSNRQHYEWDYSDSFAPVRKGKYPSHSQRFWRPNESVVFRHNQKIILPKIS